MRESEWSLISVRDPQFRHVTVRLNNAKITNFGALLGFLKNYSYMEYYLTLLMDLLWRTRGIGKYSADGCAYSSMIMRAKFIANLESQEGHYTDTATPCDKMLQPPVAA